MTRSARIFTNLLTLLALAALMGTFAIIHRAMQPPGGDGVVEITIKPGLSLQQVADALEEAGAIRSAVYFVWLAERKGQASNIKAGDYMLKKSLYPDEVLDRFVRGQVIYHRITVPEGKTCAQIARIVQNAGLGTEEAFLLATFNTEGMEPWLKTGASSLEGVLFPDTYLYSRNITPAELVKMMTDRFKKVFEPLWVQRDNNNTLNPYEALILASIVEKETGKAEERPLIAGVFLNRLKNDIRLMSDPTVIYGIHNFNGNLTRDDLERPTPYNTYFHLGLPAGPICNPGALAIEAVLHPARTDKLYFVAKGDGSHHFSATLAEHNEAVRRYQKGARRSDGR